MVEGFDVGGVVPQNDDGTAVHALLVVVGVPRRLHGIRRFGNGLVCRIDRAVDTRTKLQYEQRDQCNGSCHGNAYQRLDRTAGLEVRHDVASFDRPVVDSSRDALLQVLDTGNAGLTPHRAPDLEVLGGLSPEFRVLTHSAQQEIRLGVRQFTVHERGNLHSYCVIHTPPARAFALKPGSADRSSSRSRLVP